MRTSSLACLLAVVALACEDPEDPDGGVADLGVADLGGDVGPRDLGFDAGPVDRGVDAAPDAEPTDAEPTDAEPLDAEATDAVSLDAEPVDANDGGAEDAEPADVEPVDLGVMTSSTSRWTPVDGTPDSACTPWLLVDTATPEDPAIVGGALVIDTSVDGENVYYYQEEAALIVPGILRLEARIRVVNSRHSSPSRGPASLGFRLGADLKKNMLQLRDGEAFLLADENLQGPSVSVPTSDVPHDYLLVVDLTTGAIEVFQDGASILTGATYTEPNAGAPRNIFFGDSSLFASGSSEWYRVSHDAHVPNACP